VIAIMLLILLISAPAFIFFSAKGPGSMHAPIWFALAAGLIIGIVAQRTRLCMVGGIRDLIMFKDSYLMWGFISIFVVTLIGNLVLGDFKLGFVEQPIAHNDALWNFMGMLVAGWGSVLLGGCPLRQLILAGEGNADSAITVMGMIVGAAFAHNFKAKTSIIQPENCVESPDLSRLIKRWPMGQRWMKPQFIRKFIILIHHLSFNALHPVIAVCQIYQSTISQLELTLQYPFIFIWD